MTWTPWIQVYDPLGSPWLSTAAAAFPIVLLLVALGVLEWRAHLAALAGLVSALAVSVIVYGMPLADRDGDGALRRRLRLSADRLDHSQRRLPLQPHGRHRAVRNRQGVGRPAVERSPHPGAAGRVLVRRLHRRGRGLRHAGRDLLGAAHRPRLHAALRRRPVAHREHRAGRVRRDRDADSDARRR